MLSDVEKKVIDLLKNIDKQKCMMLECPVVKNNIERQLKIIELNRTIRKQYKEIEELKEKSNKYYYEWKHLEANMINKIKAKIEYNKVFNDDIHKYATLTLEELLEKE